MPFDHLVLTRFSAVRRGQVDPMPAEWLTYRLGFFYDACHPSLTRQVGAAPFRWLVFLDDRCSDDFREQMTELAYGAFEPVWGHEDFHTVELPQAIERYAATPGASHLITTRVDSDDAVARDFVAAVQAQFARAAAPRPPVLPSPVLPSRHTDDGLLFVNFTRGLQVDRSGAVYRRDQPHGPFLSLIERRATGAAPRTVHTTKHNLARRTAPVLEVRAEPMWLQVLHDANLRNVVAGPQVSPRVLKRRFDIDLEHDENLTGTTLLAARAGHRTRLLRQWAQHPGQAVEAGAATVGRLRGTHVRPHDPSALTAGARLREQALRLGYRPRS